MTILTRTLNAIGLMTRAEHECLCDERFQSLEGMIDSRNETIETIAADRDNWRGIARDRLMMINNLSSNAESWEAKFKAAVTDLEAEVIASESYGDQVVSLNAELARLHEIIDALRPDAQKWRNSLKRSRDRKAGKKGVGRG